SERIGFNALRFAGAEGVGVARIGKNRANSSPKSRDSASSQATVRPKPRFATIGAPIQETSNVRRQRRTRSAQERTAFDRLHELEHWNSPNRLCEIGPGMEMRDQMEMNHYSAGTPVA